MGRRTAADLLYIVALELVCIAIPAVAADTRCEYVGQGLDLGYRLRHHQHFGMGEWV